MNTKMINQWYEIFIFTSFLYFFILPLSLALSIYWWSLIYFNNSLCSWSTLSSILSTLAITVPKDLTVLNTWKLNNWLLCYNCFDKFSPKFFCAFQFWLVYFWIHDAIDLIEVNLSLISVADCFWFDEFKDFITWFFFPLIFNSF